MAEGFEKVDRLCREAVLAGVSPGMVVLAVDEGVCRFEAAWGAAQRIPTFVPASIHTVYDVASLTKAVVTSVLAMQMVGRGALDLDARLVALRPDFAGVGRGEVSLRQLLCHSAGLPAHRAFYETLRDAPMSAATDAERRAAIRRHIEDACAREPLVYPPGTRSLYTDLGFILLGSILERVAQARLDALFDAQIARPLGLRLSGFAAVGAGMDGGASWLGQGAPVAATEDCRVRGGMVVGEVHDLNAHAMGGIAGHAGLFSTVDELGRIARALVSDWQGGYEPPQLVSRDVVREFWRPAGIPGSTWRLGWDGPAPQGSQAGERLSRDSVGHLGFTGCSLWIDPARARFIIVLANRVHPAVTADPRFRWLRPALHDAIVDAFSVNKG